MNLENSAKIKTAKTKPEIKGGQNVLPKILSPSGNPNSRTKENGGTDNFLKKPGETAINLGRGR